MLEFTDDIDVTSLNPASVASDLVRLLLLLSGRDRDYLNEEELAGKARDIEDLLSAALTEETRISWEQLNELLLLVGEARVSRAFFDCFMLGLQLGEHDQAEVISMDDLKRGVTRFRGYAMLSFGNFRFAFRTLSQISDTRDICAALRPWSESSGQLDSALTSRPRPIVPIEATKISEQDTWLIGYLSSRALFNDFATAIVIKAKTEGLDPAELLKSSGLDDRSRQAIAREVSERAGIAQETVDEWKDAIDSVAERANEMWKRMDGVRESGVSNTARYLTWDFMDVYVATSMRERWEFEETYRFVDQVFKHPELRRLNVRWFDPTQSYEDSVPDKGLVEALMLRRARCTVYMAQESDTLGKDSELAATLAQGKPVVAYIRSVHSEEALRQFTAEMTNRPINSYRKRVLVLLAEDIFNDPRIVERVNAVGVKMDAGEVTKYARRLAETVETLEGRQTFLVSGGEAERLRDEFLKECPEAPKFMAAVESVWMDRRADTLKYNHPLGMQVHLETGVANGVLVVRTVEECARTIVGLLTNRLRFSIQELVDASVRLGTILVDDATGSRFRIVTDNERLTNSFWNFYLSDH